MNKRKLFFKDISGLRFIGIVLISVYILNFIITTQESSDLSKLVLPFVAALKNFGFSIFAILSAFLLTAHGLREYKYQGNFNLKHFYTRRLLRIAPTVSIALLFYFIVHPLLINILKLTSVNNQNLFLQLFLFPKYHYSINREVAIYLYFIYSVFVIVQFYLLWGIVMKYLMQYFKITLLIIFVIGIAFKLIPTSINFTPLLHLPYYFVEISLGALTAIVVRQSEAFIAFMKTISSYRLFLIYFTTIFIGLISFFFIENEHLRLASKVLLYCVVCFFIIEQTFAKHSFFKARSSLFIIRFGNLSYNFVMFLPVVAITLLISFESIEMELNSRIVIFIYILLNIVLTWVLSYTFHHSVDRFFGQIKKEYKNL